MLHIQLQSEPCTTKSAAEPQKSEQMQIGSQPIYKCLNLLTNQQNNDYMTLPLPGVLNCRNLLL